jgi:thiamine-phosphate pyrophosphorylase
MSIFMDALEGTRLYPLTDRELSELTHVEQVQKLSDSGVKIIQLREKHLTSQEFYEQAKSALHVARQKGVKLIINDRVDIALALGADGVHVGQDDLPADAARRLLGDSSIIGVSTHSREQAEMAAQLPVDYVAIGPIFSTNTKLSSNKPLGLEGLAEIRVSIGSIPLVAIGGINSENAHKVLQAGANAVAVISDLWAPADGAAKRLKRLISGS